MSRNISLVDSDIETPEQAARKPDAVRLLLLVGPRRRILSSVRLENIVQDLVLPWVTHKADVMEVGEQRPASADAGSMLRERVVEIEADGAHGEILAAVEGNQTES